MTLIPLNRDGSVLTEGDTLTDFRGDTATFISMTRPPTPGRSAKIYVQSPDGWQAEYYHQVFDITFTEETSA